MSQMFGEVTIEEYVQMHILWSQKTFGEGEHLEGLLKHIVKEVEEVREVAGDFIQRNTGEKKLAVAKELTDIIILAIDAMWRQGFTAEEISSFLQVKQQINFERKYPPITNQDEPTEHIHLCKKCGHEKGKHGPEGCVGNIGRYECGCDYYEEEA